MKTYIISFGDSDKYAVKYPGSLDEFKKSEVMEHVRKAVNDYLKKEFPTGGYSDLIKCHVEECDCAGYEVLDDRTLNSLLGSVKRQVEVLRQDNAINNNAPYDNL